MRESFVGNEKQRAKCNLVFLSQNPFHESGQKLYVFNTIKLFPV